MSKELELYSLPEAPKNLCFEKTEFSKKIFSADHFLQSHRKKANLENLRDDLGVYLKVLRSAMIDLINKDYVDFVNLSTNLIGLDRAISNIQVPLGQLKEEVLQVQSALEETRAEVRGLLESRARLQEQRRALRSLAAAQRLLGALSALLVPCPSGEFPALLERAALQFNELQFHTSRCGDLLAASHAQQAEQASSRLLSGLNAVFLDGARQRDAPGMKRCLRIYLSLGRADVAEELLRREVVSPAMQDVVCEASLRADPGGLRGLYARVLAFVDDHMGELLELTAHPDRSVAVSGFDFLTNSFWVEVEERLERDLTSVVAFGIPEVFHQNYCETADFLEKLEAHFRTREELLAFRQHPQYKAFLDHWNLTVYFPIRWKEIVSCVETALAEGRRLAQGSQFNLLSSTVAWESLERCWARGVFLPLLANRFWKLSLMIISRYCTWISEVLEQGQSAGSEADGGAATDRLQFLVHLHGDVLLFADKLPDFGALALRQLPAVSEGTLAKLRESLEDSGRQLAGRVPAVTQCILGEVSRDSLAQLRQVGDIPRLFRRTNRDAPSRPCAYVAAVLAVPLAFHAAQRGAVPPDTLREWLRLVFSAVTGRYHSAVGDVLTSVQRTEESLRRLKKARDRSSGAAPPGDARGPGDDDKIRLQLALDVTSYCEGVESVGLKREEVTNLVELLELVRAAQTRNDAKS
ncbi:conserved oligomeric Golgi complex subunit 2 [Bacillus rossius redtenbacheri]|uniref:conserved oligomeric Golgi complex subunit 2 n=1 Tax=Bacillus rossius redtenbacheri TaxID=93214 RepID=UPI002FDC94DF